jgi:transketolase C-terminal domain/subunit
MAQFGEKYPDRLIIVGIAEQNMTGVAAGLAYAAKLPVVLGICRLHQLAGGGAGQGGLRL